MSGRHTSKSIICNSSTAKSLDDIAAENPSRRRWLKTSAALGFTGTPFAQWLSTAAIASTANTTGAISFTRISVSTSDTVRVPDGYTANVFYRWGDPIGAASVPAGSPAWRADASNTAAEQELQAGMHHDGMHYFSLPDATDSAPRGLLAINHEYTDDGLLHIGGMEGWSADKVRKSQAAHGVSIIEVAFVNNNWEVVRPSKYARRVTANTAMRIAGPAAGSPLMKTNADPTGNTVLGTFANCAHGHTPWGTYLTCEENWHGYFSQPNDPNDLERRYGLSERGAGYRWADFDPRFDVTQTPNEPNRFGWVVEIDPFEPNAMPVKRTALGRFKHESAMLSIGPDNRVAWYMGDDERFEYIYKFVSRDKWNASDRKANSTLLDNGTLYVARFEKSGRGKWLPLVYGVGPLTLENGFANQGDVLIKTRLAADALGATPMDRAEWIAVHPKTREVYVTLTNNTDRGAPHRPKTDGPNPRAGNRYGQVVRWRELGNTPTATEFNWDVFVLAGDGDTRAPNRTGNIKGDLFAAPDGIWFDAQGRLWIQTDISTSVLNRDEYAIFGNNQMLVADPVTGECKRFLTGPRGCEITGITSTPDGRHLFVNIQHPGETASERSDPTKPQAISSWPDGPEGVRPRSATIVIRKNDNGIIGT
jgi:uncharacterized protein